MNAFRAITRIQRMALCCLLAMPATVAWAERGVYRVEILVFRHNQAEHNPVESAELSYFPGAWRLFEERAVIYPEDPAPLGVMSDRMRDAWRRLERSEAYQPLYMQAWEQSRTDYHPPVRVHDDRVMFERIVLPEAADIDLTAPDFFAPYRQRYHQLDGTAQLRRSRFLHLEFDLEFRLELISAKSEELPENGIPADMTLTPVEPLPVAGEPLGERLGESVFAPLEPASDEETVDGPEPLLSWRPPPPLSSPMPDTNPAVPGALLYRLRESRQIRTGQLLYFDAPHLGVIARVTTTAGE